MRIKKAPIGALLVIAAILTGCSTNTPAATPAITKTITETAAPAPTVTVTETPAAFTEPGTQTQKIATNGQFFETILGNDIPTAKRMASIDAALNCTWGDPEKINAEPSYVAYETYICEMKSGHHAMLFQMDPAAEKNRDKTIQLLKRATETSGKLPAATLLVGKRALLLIDAEALASVDLLKIGDALLLALP